MDTYPSAPPPPPRSGAAPPEPMPPWRPPPPPPVEHPQGTTVIVLGVLSIVGFAFLGPFAWAMGRRALAQADAAPFPTANRSVLETGTRLGRWGTYILIGTVAVVTMAVLAVVMLETGTAAT
ncbi:DUF4190 domain-containing protein [Ornithinimicrobium pratense]|uniref:DUF4190 domain-containing protein n=1 Tax=Ornithinimicrobium pratense TaxID=2593973 RepID=A0A5J6V737_9MICO|nr:DUF4190 domain-containing protein [Ornithinimicrobium pratense]QFG69639.1 DUF4190 domain-containing protein [Ornithinimicrobium pratense]